MTFAWTNLSKTVLEGLARATGLRVTQAESDLRDRFGEPPGLEFVRVAWPALRDIWVARSPAARVRLMENLALADLGDQTASIATKADQLRFIASCGDDQVVLEHALATLLKVGSLPYDMPAESHDIPEAQLSLPFHELLRRGCKAVTAPSVAALEVGAWRDAALSIRDVTLSEEVLTPLDAAALTVDYIVFSLETHARRGLPITPPPAEYRADLITGAARLATDRTAREVAVERFLNDAERIWTTDTGTPSSRASALAEAFLCVVAFGAEFDAASPHVAALSADARWAPAVIALDSAGFPEGLRAPHAMDGLEATGQIPDTAWKPASHELAEAVLLCGMCEKWSGDVRYSNIDEFPTLRNCISSFGEAMYRSASLKECPHCGARWLEGYEESWVDVPLESEWGNRYYIRRPLSWRHLGELDAADGRGGLNIMEFARETAG